MESVTSRSETCVFARTKRSPLAESGRAMAVVVIMPRQMLVSEAVSDLGRLTPAFSVSRPHISVFGQLDVAPKVNEELPPVVGV